MPQDFQEHTEGSYYDRENKQKERAQMNKRILGARRALMATGLGVAALFGLGAATGTIPIQNGNEPSPKPIPTETIQDKTRLYEDILSQHPDAKAFIDGKIRINFTHEGKSLFPLIRTSPDFDANYDRDNIIHNYNEFMLFNNTNFDWSKNTTLEVLNPVVVEGSDPYNRNNPNKTAGWLAVSLTGADGNTVIGYISRHSATADYVHVDEGGKMTSLDLLINSPQVKDLNNTNVLASKP